MFKTSAKFGMLASRVLQTRRPTAGPHHAPANDNRPAKVRPHPLVCRWSLAADGTGLACHWEVETDASGPRPRLPFPGSTSEAKEFHCVARMSLIAAI
jgi:hypothetical protein